MRQIILQNGSAVLPDRSLEDASILIEDEIITSIDGGSLNGVEILDCSGLSLFPGFIDVHIHGAVGVDVNAADLDGLVDVAKYLASNGVAAWLPTLVPDSDENYARVIAVIDRLMEVQSDHAIAQAIGVHYEGVFANEKMCGALRPQYFKKFSGNEVSQLPRLRRGVHMMTFAPEVERGIELTRELVANGWLASIGHTRAEVETLEAAFAAGARHMTHFFNAMSGIHHRQIGVAGWGLANREVTIDIIADGIHVHPAMLALACRTKSVERVTLISDSVSPTGLGDGDYEVWGEQVSVNKGRTKNERGSIAGSVITILDAVKRIQSLGFSQVETARMASQNPAALLGVSDLFGSIGVGKRADLVGLDEAGEPQLVLIGGRIAVDKRL